MNINKITVPIGGTLTILDVIDTISRTEMSEIEAYIGYTDEDIAGIEADFENNTFTRLAGAIGKSGGSDFNSFPTYAGMRRCNLSDSGVVNAYYGDNDFIEDGSNGQVMVEIPRFYYKVIPLKLQKQDWSDYGATAWTSGTSYAVGKVVIYNGAYYACITANSDEEFMPAKWHEIEELGLMGYHLLKARYYVSATPKDGFKVHPAFIDKTTGNLRDYVYIGAYSGIAYDVSAGAYLLNDEQVIDTTAITGDKLSSIGGTYERSYTYYDKTTGTYIITTVNAGAKPASGQSSNNNLTRYNCTILAHNRGDGWEQQTIEIVSAIQLLCAVEYCSFNWQTVIGNGVTGITDDDSSTNCASFVGSTSSLGNTTGNATTTIDHTGTSQNTSGKVSCNYRGIEDFFGNIFKWVEGLNCYGEYNNGGGQLFYCTDNVYTEGRHDDNYVGVGFTMANYNGFAKYFGYGSENFDWLFYTSKSGGNATSSVPIGDQTAVAACMDGHRLFADGGRWLDSLNAGGYYWVSTYGISYRSRFNGCRLAYLPSA